mgnify:CR=1 FL=1
MKISLEQIKTELESQKWQLISTEYHTLNDQLIVKCPEGHTVYAPWKQLRSSPICPICKNNKYHNIGNKVSARPRGAQRVLVFDQATHISGWTVFDGGELSGYGCFESQQADEIDRDLEIKNWLLSLIESYKPDVVGLEGIQFQDNAGVTTFQTLARLQGILMMAVKESGIPFQICPAAVWRGHCQVKGKTRADKKKSMQLLVKGWYDISVTEDEADAIGIGKFLSETYNAPLAMAFHA